jgi:hypothetical protein
MKHRIQFLRRRRDFITLLGGFSRDRPGINSASQLDEANRLLEIAAFCCATGVSLGEISERPKGLLSEKTDWYGLIRAAGQHRMLPLVYHSLRNLAEGSIPKSILAAFESYYNENRKRNSALIEELVKAIELLKAHEIRAIPYKGPMLAIAAYGDVGGRQASDDLDILVHWHDFVRAKNVLLSHGFREWMILDWKSHLHRPVDKLEIDLHHSFTPTWYGFSLDFDEIWDRRKSFVLSGTSLPCFCLEDLIIALCLDLAKDTAQRRFVPLLKLCDIAGLLKAECHVNWNGLLNYARQKGVLGPISFGIRTVGSLFDISVPNNIDANLVISPIDGKERLQIFAAFLQNNTVFSSKNSQFARSMREAFVIVSLHDRIRHKIRTVLRQIQLRRYLTPSSSDIMYISLPRYLHFLYYLVRPIRIAIKYFSRAAVWLFR